MGHPNLVRSHHRTLQRGLHATLDAVLDLKERLNLTDVVEKTGLSASTAHRIIRGLERRDYLSRNEDTKRYSLGARIAYLGSLAENRSDDGLREKAYEYLVKIRDRINESARVCLKIHSHHLHAPLRGIFGPNSVNVARYAFLIGTKSPAKCDAQLTESNFRTRPGPRTRKSRALLRAPEPA